MATQAQIDANRANAQKSTGPRTPEGKAISALNALRHGLLAREGFLRGEDEIDYQIHRDRLWGYLGPGAPLEEILANRIIDLTWRLQRCAQDQAEAFAKLFDQTLAGTPEPEDEAERGEIIGQMLVEDFRGEAVLERLQRYERRIEGGFYRALNEMRRVFDQRVKAERQEDEAFRERLAQEREDKWDAYKRKMFARAQAAVLADEPIGTVTNAPGETIPEACGLEDAACGGPACQTKPMAEEAGCVSRTASCDQKMVRGTHPTNGAGDQPLVPELLRQTNPIGREPNEGQVLDNQGVSRDSPQNRAEETKPIRVAPEAWEAVAAAAGGAGGPAAVTGGR